MADSFRFLACLIRTTGEQTEGEPKKKKKISTVVKKQTILEHIGF